MTASQQSAFLPAIAALAFAIALAAPLAAQQSGIPAPTPARPEDRPVAAPGLTPGPGTGPNGATMRCKDGSYPEAGAPDSACDAKGGILVRFPVRRTPPPAQARPEPRAPAVRPAVPARDTLPPEGAESYAERRAAEVRATPPTQRPAGATLLCQDGTYVVRDTTAARCAAKGGVRLRFELPRNP